MKPQHNGLHYSCQSCQDAKSDGRHIRSTIEDAVTEASDAVAAHAASNEDLRGMGATCAMAWIIGDELHTAYVGDSRIYLMRAGRIQQLTTDHTWVQEAMEKGILTPEQARTHPNVHVIRRYLGSAEPPEPDFRLKWFDGEEWWNRRCLGGRRVCVSPQQA